MTLPRSACNPFAYSVITKQMMCDLNREGSMRFKRLLSLAVALAIASSLAFAQRPPLTTPPTFPDKKSKSKNELIDINSAAREQLVALPGIGEEYADKIIAGRPYRSKKELKTKKIIPEANYKQIADRITARQTTK